MRPDRGQVPAALGRADIEAFLHRLAFLESTGNVSADARNRACREVRDRPGPDPGARADPPRRRRRRPGRGLRPRAATTSPPNPNGREPAVTCRRRSCDSSVRHLDTLTSTGDPHRDRAGHRHRPATRRDLRPAPATAWPATSDGAPVLVYDNHKADRLGRRLPISEATAAVIIAQQAAGPGPLPRHPGRRAEAAAHRPAQPRRPTGHHRVQLWRSTTATGSTRCRRCAPPTAPSSTRAGSCPTPTGTPTPNATPTPASRSTCSASCMDHRNLDITSSYYRVGDGRRRDAVDRVAAMQFDRHGNRIWRDAHALLDSEHARRAVGEVAVPFGVCTEPSNVQAGGGACPVRFRCAGCDHFRTDVSYLPDLHAYLDDLLRTRERLLRRHRHRRLGPRRRHPLRPGDHPDPTADHPHQRRPRRAHRRRTSPDRRRRRRRAPPPHRHARHAHASATPLPDLRPEATA